MTKPVHYLTLDEAHVRLLKLREKAGSGSIPVLSSGHGRELSVCKFELGKAATRNVYQRVTRAGQPAVLASLVSKKDPVLTLDGALALFDALKAEAGSGDIPLLFSNDTAHLELCDLWPSQAGATDMFRIVSRGGQPIVNLVLMAPDKD